MRKIINGKTYNTETATKIATGNNGKSPRDCWYRTEELYKTKKGSYFICNEHSDLIAVEPTTNGGFVLTESYYRLDVTILDWCEFWRVSVLPAQESALFGLTDV